MTMDYRRTRSLTKITALGLLALTGTLMLGEGDAHANPAYIRSNVGAPWGQTVNEEAMDMVFGIGSWDDLRYETVDAGLLLSPTYTFIYMEGSDSNALELETFLMANQAALEIWVTNGGTLLLNAAPNEGGMQDWGFGGVTLHYSDSSVDPGTAVDPMHPIWQGPFLPTVDMWTGSAYAHASVSGPGLIPLIIDSNGGNPNLAELAGPGMGRVLFGGLTTSNYWTPAAESLNLRANMIAYLAAGDDDMDGLDDFADNCPTIFNPMQEDMDMDGIGDVCDICVDDPGNDLDMDTVCAAMDNCPDDANPMQEDADMDGVGDPCDACPADDDMVADVDRDMICAAMDNCPDDANADQADADADGAGDVCDVCPGDPDDDIDGDGVCGDEDNCPDDANEDQADEDGDGVGDVCDSGEDDTGGDSSGDGSTGDPPGTGGETGLDPDTGAGPGGSDESGGDSGGSTGGDSGGQNSDDGGGCSCSTEPDGGHIWWAALLFGLRLRRRRRAA